MEEYRYDALGRRILVRSRCLAIASVDPACHSYVERIVWDGDQTLYEIRAPGSDSAQSWQEELDNASGDNLGQVAYIHAGGIDQPLAVFKVGVASLAPHANFLGDYAVGSWIDGSCRGHATTDLASCQTYPTLLFPGGNITADGVLMTAAPAVWFGDLLTQRSDGSKLQFRRNRYYDPQTGRFTQEDPIGLAGGLNLYGFANGDPVSNSDPFGLATCPPFCDFGTTVALVDAAFRRRWERESHCDCVVPTGHEALLVPVAAAVVRGAGAVATLVGGGTEAAIAPDVAELAGALREASTFAARGGGNYGVEGTFSVEQANAMGRAWVGEGAVTSSDGTALISENGLRQYRFPSFKPSQGIVQANLEERAVARGAFSTNVHVAVRLGPDQ